MNLFLIQKNLEIYYVFKINIKYNNINNIQLKILILYFIIILKYKNNKYTNKWIPNSLYQH